MTSKARWFWPLALALLFTDCATKRAVEHRLAVGETRPVVGHRTQPSERLRLIGVALVAGGALGNLVDRIRSSAGVVDFIDVGIANVRFWTFNVADMGITAGAVLLLLALGRKTHSRGLSASQPSA